VEAAGVIVLDTTVISELARPQADPAVVAWADSQKLTLLYATATSEAEMLYGVALLPAGRRQADLHRAISTVFSILLSGRVLPLDRAAAEEFADWAANHRRAGRPVAMADLQIAAIARTRGRAQSAHATPGTSPAAAWRSGLLP
jgi:toxin FitB